MSEPLHFENREAFRAWLAENGTTSGGVWLLFGKKGGPKTLKAGEALEEALCFGWIDGQMQSLDAGSYRKYFARRTEKSQWSEKNRKLVQTLIERAMVTEQGMAAIECAKRNGTWDTPETFVLGEAQIAQFIELIQPHERAYTNLMGMPRSVHKTYTGFFLDTKSDKTRQDRLAKIIDRLDRNLKPMDRG